MSVNKTVFYQIVGFSWCFSIIKTLCGYTLPQLLWIHDYNPAFNCHNIVIYVGFYSETSKLNFHNKEVKSQTGPDSSINHIKAVIFVMHPPREFYAQSIACFNLSSLHRRKTALRITTVRVQWSCADGLEQQATDSQGKQQQMIRVFPGNLPQTRHCNGLFSRNGMSC